MRVPPTATAGLNDPAGQIADREGAGEDREANRQAEIGIAAGGLGGGDVQNHVGQGKREEELRDQGNRDRGGHERGRVGAALQKVRGRPGGQRAANCATK